MGVSRFIADVSEEVMLSEIAQNWEECERKSQLKYPRRSGRLRAFLEFFLNAFFYSVTILQLWRRIGLRMPAPYSCLQTVLRCFYAGSYLEAMTINARGMSHLIASAESTALMYLFLATRKLKKLATSFAAKSKKVLQFKDLNASVIVLVSKDLLNLSVPFVQTVLYSGIPLTMIVDATVDRSRLPGLIRDHFKYALKRRYISTSEVDEKMNLLQVCEAAEVEERLGEYENSSSVIVISASGSSSSSFSLDLIATHFDKVCVGFTDVRMLPGLIITLSVRTFVRPIVKVTGQSQANVNKV